jgi:hypothetical protein
MQDGLVLPTRKTGRQMTGLSGVVQKVLFFGNTGEGIPAKNGPNLTFNVGLKSRRLALHRNLRFAETG